MSSVVERLSTALADRYRIERELGQGGMATVYLAEDLKHKRNVAVKVLKPELAAVLGAERFVQEITTTAALQHPHILPLFDSGAADGFLYYVMPFIDGETLRAKLDRETQLGVEEAVRIARDVADALHYAHTRGIVHRDVKPENILLHDGRPMVADFGIALAVSAAAGGRMTETGLSLGTPHYMSPEQATAEKEITARSDVYSIGSVLYEMLAGNPPHTGASAQQIIMKIITAPAESVTMYRKAVPPNVAAAVAKSLEKLPADRFESAKAFAEALGNPAFTVAGVAGGAGTVAGAVSGRVRIMPWVLGAGIGALLSAAALLVLRPATRAPDEMPALHAEIALPGARDSAILGVSPALSPDGAMLVFTVQLATGTPRQLYLRRLGERVAQPIPGTEGAGGAAFSPDGQSIAFIQNGTAIRRIAVSGGTTTTLVQYPQGGLRPLSWAADGFLYYSTGKGLHRVSETGGTPTALVEGAKVQSIEPLPGGRHVLYVECCNTTGDVRVLDLTTRTTRSLGLRSRFARYLPTGHLVLVSRDALQAVPFDVRTAELRGSRKTLLDSAQTNGLIVDMVMANNGTMSYTVTDEGYDFSDARRLVLVDRAGQERLLPLSAASYRDMRFSPDGRRLAFVSGPPDSVEVYRLSVYDLMTGSTTLLAPRLQNVGNVRWLPDGRSVLLSTMADSLGQAVVRVRADGTGRVDTVWHRRPAGSVSDRFVVGAITPAGNQVLLHRRSISDNTDQDLFIASLDTVLGTPREYLAADWMESSAGLSADGRWAVYESTEEALSGWPPQVYVRSFPDPGPRFSVSADSLSSWRYPRWSADGKAIYWWHANTLMAATVETTPTFRVTARRALFTRLQSSLPFDVSPDGQRFVMLQVPPGTRSMDVPTQTRLVVVGNWLRDFKSMMGVSK